jgi:hypothetical protein
LSAHVLQRIFARADIDGERAGDVGVVDQWRFDRRGDFARLLHGGAALDLAAGGAVDGNGDVIVNIGGDDRQRVVRVNVDGFDAAVAHRAKCRFGDRLITEVDRYGVCTAAREIQHVTAAAGIAPFDANRVHAKRISERMIAWHVEHIIAV